MKKLTKEQIKNLHKANLSRFTDTGKEFEILIYDYEDYLESKKILNNVIEIFNNELAK
jgi:hypothetical protein